MTESTPYCVLMWEDEGAPTDPLYTARSFYVRHEEGQVVSDAMVLAQFQAEIGHYPAGRYRLYPADSVVDVTVESKVVLA